MTTSTNTSTNTSTSTTPLYENKILQERLKHNIVDLTNYNKHNGERGIKTGCAMITNEHHIITNLSVIDIDINKTLDEENKKQIRNNIICKLSDDDIIVKTGSGGLHIYANIGDMNIKQNRYIKCFTCDDYDIDLLSSVEPKQSLVVLPDSKVRNIKTNESTTYEFLQGSFDSVISRTVQDVVNDLGIALNLTKSITSNNRLCMILHEEDVVNEEDETIHLNNYW